MKIETKIIIFVCILLIASGGSFCAGYFPERRKRIAAEYQLDEYRRALDICREFLSGNIEELREYQQRINELVRTGSERERYIDDLERIAVERQRYIEILNSENESLRTRLEELRNVFIELRARYSTAESGSE